MIIPTVDAARLALTPYLLWIKLAAVLLVVLAIFGAGAKVGYGFASHRVDALKAEQAQQDQKRAEAAIAAERAYTAKLNEASRGYQAALARLRDRPVPDARPVRLCVDAPRVPRATAAGGPRSTTAPGGVVHGAIDPDPAVRPGPDIGPALQRLAGRADEVTEQARGLQAAQQH